MTLPQSILVVVLALTNFSYGVKQSTPNNCVQQLSGANLKHERTMKEAEQPIVSTDQPSKLILSEEIQKRFWDKVNKNGPISRHLPDGGPCWIWTAYKRETGHGQFGYHGKVEHSHRVAFFMEVGVPPPETPYILHNCHNASCVNPSHLRAGTHRENMRDMAESGTWKPRKMARCQNHGNAKLTNEQVLEIRMRVDVGESQISLTKEYKISPSVMSCIIRRQTWNTI